MKKTKVRKRFLWGVFMGFVLGFHMRNNGECKTQVKDLNQNYDQLNVLMLIGVQTAAKYLNTRVRAAHETSTSTIYGNVLFFIGEGQQHSSEKQDFPLMTLKGVADDMYPPQKKSFLMLKYMYDFLIDKYEWFVRADDDVYIIGSRLAKFLSSMNSSNLYYIGQSGGGRPDEEGKLGLNTRCSMEGPGAILSRATLIKLGPFIEVCLQNISSKHLVKYLKYLRNNKEHYLKYLEWRKRYKIFTANSLCTVCKNAGSFVREAHKNISGWWQFSMQCINWDWNKTVGTE